MNSVMHYCFGNKKQKVLDKTYDTEFRISDLTDFLASDAGWPVESAREIVNKSVTLGQAKVAVSGLFNRGKTHILNRLAGLHLPSGTFTETVGICCKKPKDGLMDPVVLLDTAGSYVPVKGGGQDDDAWSNRLGTECLLRDVILDLADIHIIVVNELTWTDQVYIRDMLVAMQERSKVLEDSVWVVHNLRSMKLADLNTYITQRIEPYYPSGLPRYHDAEKQYRWWVDIVQGPRHVFLVNDDTSEGHKYNDMVFSDLRKWMVTIKTAAPRTNLMKAVCDSINANLRTYVTASSPEMLTVAYDETKKAICFTNPEHRSSFQLKAMALPKGLVASVYVRGEINPPRRVALVREGRSLEVLVDTPGVDPGSIVVTTNVREGQLIVRGKRSPLADVQRVIHSRGPPIVTGTFETTISLSNEHGLMWDRLRQEVRNGCLCISCDYHQDLSQERKDVDLDEKSDDEQPQQPERPVQTAPVSKDHPPPQSGRSRSRTVRRRKTPDTVMMAE